jgi:asparagine synthase (glutamine-hydrolysing)
METSLSALKYRGPDAQGLVVGIGYALGHTRLSIIDLANSHQPMLSPDQRFELSFNGEIYNYRQLRLELESRWNFCSDGDTEVVLAGLILEGQSFCKKMSGMWSIIFWDNLKKELLLSRDRFGKKPLYYYQSENEFAAASEIPALKTLLPGHEFCESSEQVVDFIRHGFFRSGKTIYKNVAEVLPGHCIAINLNQFVSKQESYWKLQPREFLGSKADAEAQFKELFLKSLQQRLVADVEVGCLLSGGVDSSIITSCLKKEFGISLRTFTVGFTDKSYDESDNAAYVAEYLGVPNEIDIVESLNYNDLIELLDNHVGQPFGDASLLPTALVSKLASKSVKVCLSGDGADEVLSGYQRYQARSMYQWYIRIPSSIRSLIRRSLKCFPASHKHHSRSVLKKAQLFVDLMERYERSNSYLVPKTLSPEDEFSLFPFLNQQKEMEDATCLDGYFDDVLKMMACDLSIYLPQDILLKSDRASMANSLELRSPFLDYELVEFAFSLPRKWHRRGALGKCMLRDSMSSYLPDRVWGKRKQGFSMPLGGWFMGGLGDRLSVLAHDSTVDKEVSGGILKALQLHREREQDFSLFLWPMFSYLHWRQKEYNQ